MSQAALRVVSKEDNQDRKRALEAALSQIDRAFGKGSVMKLGSRDLGVATDAVSTGSLGLDIALGIGGLPRGRVIEIYGPESSGKTTLARCTLLRKPRRRVASPLMWMPSMRWTPAMPASWAWTSMKC